MFHLFPLYRICIGGLLAAISFAAACLCTACMCPQAECARRCYPKGSPVARHGALRVVGRQLCGSDGQPVVLRGVSTHDLVHFGRFANRQGIQSLAQDWHVSVVRAALYLTTYLPHREVEKQVDEIVAACAENGIYCIIDWHVLSEQNPQATQAEAAQFFARKAAQYRDQPHVLFEICNEPNGADVNWHDHVKPYAEAIIPIIRREAPKAVILVGTPRWSQDVDRAASEPLDFDNVMYVVHFYAGSHGEELREKVRQAGRKIPIFCSEWGTTLASGDGGPFPQEATTWLDFIESNGISWCNWSLSDANEASAIFRPGAPDRGKWTDADLTVSGRFVRDRLQVAAVKISP